jgi:hypothetical protein
MHLTFTDSPPPGIVELYLKILAICSYCKFSPLQRCNKLLYAGVTPAVITGVAKTVAKERVAWTAMGHGQQPWQQQQFRIKCLLCSDAAMSYFSIFSHLIGPGQSNNYDTWTGASISFKRRLFSTNWMEFFSEMETEKGEREWEIWSCEKNAVSLASPL